ncbi:patatin-like phospholipase family protein [Asticcacaulis sp. EMRT-3]|uniref:patatin-like phospholipase family protein n=1 Tax=Asticcacaulis sp. EMRT-3 TaxID=3040349 RepID=UPI0024AF6095|nr:patatin-like phospholipase family protein [Asticcacaulis sp. EMRT-3]MDI7773728.1 patatin-like phospholipase family protein [Asticcacaulis sp. EMRT-3]
MSFDNTKPSPKTLHRRHQLKLPYDQTVLVMQGGGALGAYQAGAYEVLHESGVEPDWIAGISIGAINAAIIAGNAPEDRVRHLRAFWEEISTSVPGESLARGHGSAEFGFRQLSGLQSLMSGVKGFFRPWFFLPWFNREGTPEATSFYDTAPLRETLLRHVDFDRINKGPMRLSLGTVHVKTGNFVYFDSHEPERVIGPEHVMASAALPPGFPAVYVDGEAYWDGGLVSNTPLSYVLDAGVAKDTLIFQIDLFSAVGPVPQNMDEVQERIKDITYSSRTRLNTDAFLEKYRLRHAIRALAQYVPEADLARLCDQRLPADVFDGRVSLVHIINRSNRREIQAKDFEFWRVSIEGHWRDGMRDARTAMAAETWREFSDPDTGLAVYDYMRPDSDAR